MTGSRPCNGLWLLIGLFVATACPLFAQDQPKSLYEQLINLGNQEDFPPLTGTWKLALPRDHGAHPKARSESWNVVAHLADEDGAPVTLQFSLTRLGLRAEAGARPLQPTALYRGHVILTGPELDLAEERLSRGLGAAGHDAGASQVWLDQWIFDYSGEDLTLSLDTGPTPIRLTLGRTADATKQNASGEGPFRGYAIPRAIVAGQIGEHSVTGAAWLDHLWGDVPLPGGPLAYDRLILHMDNGSALSLLRTRRRDGPGIATLDGVLFGSDNRTTAFTDEDVDLTVTQTYAPENSDADYPVGWRLSGAGLDLNVTPLDPDQRQPFTVPVWSGGVRATGSIEGVAVQGLGTLQLTGYEE